MNGCSAAPFLAMVFVLRTTLPDVIVYENVPGQPADLLPSLLPEYTWDMTKVPDDG